MSDLGPRNQCPYLQQIDRNQRETGLAGHSLGGGEEREQRRRSCSGGWGYKGEEGCAEGGGSIQMIQGIHLLSQEGVMQRTLRPDGHSEKSSHQGMGNNAAEDKGNGVADKGRVVADEDHIVDEGHIAVDTEDEVTGNITNFECQ